MEFALGGLNWSPDQFWASTMTELLAADEGVKKANGSQNEAPLSKDEFEELKDKLG